MTESGDPAGRPVMFHHGTPGARTLPAWWDEPARARGLRLVAHDRAGYGGSSPSPGRSVASAAADAEVVADALRLDRFAVWGVSGGGPHVLACAALLPARVAGVAAVATPAPSDAQGLDWLAGMGQQNVDEFGAARQGRDAVRAYVERDADAMRQLGPSGLIEAMQSLLPPVDETVLREPAAAGYLFANFEEALRPGVDGWVDDDLAFVAPWGFDPADIRVPASVWHGAQDLMAPVAHGSWVAARIPGVEHHVLADHGHLSLGLGRPEPVMDWLARQLG